MKGLNLQEIYYTETKFPTVFTIEIREFGWIHDVFLEVDGNIIFAEWYGYVNCRNGSRYSLFRVYYTFDKHAQNQKAIFHYYVNGCEHVCMPMIYTVE